MDGGTGEGLRLMLCAFTCSHAWLTHWGLQSSFPPSFVTSPLIERLKIGSAFTLMLRLVILGCHVSCGLSFVLWTVSLCEECVLGACTGVNMAWGECVLVKNGLVWPELLMDSSRLSSWLRYVCFQNLIPQRSVQMACQLRACLHLECGTGRRGCSRGGGAGHAKHYGWGSAGSPAN